MSSTQAKGRLFLSLLTLLLAACSGTADLPNLTTAATGPLYVSASADRSGAVGLSNTRLQGEVYIFARASGVRKAAFYLDDKTRSRAPRHMEWSAPYDFMGGSRSAANPFDTRTLKDGAHTLTLALTFTGGRTQVTHAAFNVENAAVTEPAPTPEPSPAPTPTPSPDPAPAQPTDFASEMLRLVNDARRSGYDCGSRGVFAATAALTLESRLTSAAQGHADDMNSQGYFSHTGHDGSTVGSRVTRQGYAWSRVGENIAYGYADADRVMAGWLSSDGHCANIMNPGYTELGVGKGGLYWVQVFARPR